MCGPGEQGLVSAAVNHLVNHQPKSEPTLKQFSTAVL